MIRRYPNPNPSLLFVTHDLIVGRERLMPWRTILEIVEHLRRLDTDCQIVTLNRPDFSSVSLPPFVEVVEKKGLSWPRKLAQTIESRSPELVFWPISLRSILRDAILLSQLDDQIGLICYFPGTLYNFEQIRAALKYVSCRELAVYVAESLASIRLAVGVLKRVGVLGLITMTPYNLARFRDAGWPEERAVAIPPGLTKHHRFTDTDARVDPGTDLQDAFSSAEKILLFLGSPHPIRGGTLLLDAFSKCVSYCPHLNLVILLRSDPGVQYNSFMAKVKSTNLGSRIFIVTRKLLPQEIQWTLSNCWAVALPFLLVPSEIPLTFLEAAQAAKPVLTTDCGGTALAVQNFALIASPATPKLLAEKIALLYHSPGLYEEKSNAAKRFAKQIPTWENVAQSWKKFAINMACRIKRNQKKTGNMTWEK